MPKTLTKPRYREPSRSPRPTPRLPALIAAADDQAQLQIFEFFAVNIRDPHTRRAYVRATGELLGWCADRGVTLLAAVQPLHVAGWIEALGREASAPTLKRRLAGIRHLFDWLVVGHVVPKAGARPENCPQRAVRWFRVIATRELDSIIKEFEV